MKILIAVAAIAMTGCATQKTTYLPDGSQGYSIDCSGQALNWGMCQTKAGEICGARGYDVVSQDGEQSPTAVANSNGLYAGAFVQRTMLIKCKAN